MWEWKTGETNEVLITKLWCSQRGTKDEIPDNLQTFLNYAAGKINFTLHFLKSPQMFYLRY